MGHHLVAPSCCGGIARLDHRKALTDQLGFTNVSMPQITLLKRITVPKTRLSGAADFDAMNDSSIVRFLRYAEIDRIYRLKLPDCVPKKERFMMLKRLILPVKIGFASFWTLPR